MTNLTKTTTRTKTTIAIALSLISWASATTAQPLAQRAAEIFKNGCLSQAVLTIENGSKLAKGASAAQTVGSVFLSYDKQGKSKGLVGTPQYQVDSSQTVGTFYCYVGSSNLTSAQLLPYFDRLSRVATNGAPLPPIEPARIDGATKVPAQGKRMSFPSSGRKLIFQAIRVQGDNGPFGGFMIMLYHRIGT